MVEKVEVKMEVEVMGAGKVVETEEMVGKVVVLVRC